MATVRIVAGTMAGGLHTNETNKSDAKCSQLKRDGRGRDFYGAESVVRDTKSEHYWGSKGGEARA